MYNTRKERDETTETGGNDLVLHLPHIVGSDALVLWRALDQAIHRQMLGHGFHGQLVDHGQLVGIDLSLHRQAGDLNVISMSWSV
jgi:hypothetical protein